MSTTRTAAPRTAAPRTTAVTATPARTASRSDSRSATRTAILDACRTLVLSDGFAALSTRKVADEAGVPLSQIHYHFGSKAQMVVATLDEENRRLVDRQAAMFAGDEPFSEQWSRACDYLDRDVASGYVRILHEMIAAGLSDHAVRVRVHDMLAGWTQVIAEAIRHHYRHGLRLGTLTVEEAAALTGAAFLGAEVFILADQETREVPMRDALRAVGGLIAAAETA